MIYLVINQETVCRPYRFGHGPIMLHYLDKLKPAAVVAFIRARGRACVHVQGLRSEVVYSLLMADDNRTLPLLTQFPCVC